MYKANSKEKTWKKIKIQTEGRVGYYARSGCSLTAIGNKVYIVAGQDISSNVSFNDILCLDIDTWTISKVEIKSKSPPPRHSHTCVAFSGHCLVRKLFERVLSQYTDLWYSFCLEVQVKVPL